MLRTKKALFQGALLIAGIVMLCVGVMRGEADTVLSKAIRLCLECVGLGIFSKAGSIRERQRQSACRG